MPVGLFHLRDVIVVIATGIGVTWSDVDVLNLTPDPYLVTDAVYGSLNNVWFEWAVFGNGTFVTS